MPQLNDSTIDLLTSYATRVVGVLIVLFIAVLIAGWVKRLVQKACTKGKVDPTLGKFFSNSARYLVIVLAVIACLGVFGIETTSFAAVLGAAGLAIGLAFQGSLSNLAAGVMLLAFRPFKVDDWVRAAGEVGRIDEIELFTTRMVTADNRLIILPNSSVFGGTIENITFFPTRRVEVVVGTEYPADLDEVRKVLESAIEQVEHHAEPAPQVYLDSMGDSAIIWKLRIWVDTPNFWGAREKLTYATKKQLDAAGIGIPFPQVDVHFDEPVVNAIGKNA